MKSIQLIAIFIFVILTQTNGQTFCLKLSKVSQASTTLTIKIEMQGSSTFKLGTSNLQFSFPQDALSAPVLNSSPLAPPFYQIPTVTEPAPGEASLNIELAFADFGTTIAAIGSWTELARVNFTIDDINQDDDLVWSYNGGTTQTVAFLDNEATQIFATAPACLETLVAPLPVEMLSFEAHKNKNTVLLNWATASESQNKGFEVLKSKNGYYWQKMGWVDGQGTASIENHYSFVDQNPNLGVNYYQLKQYDFDGSYQFSPIKQLAYQSYLDELSIYPNPSKNRITIDYQGDHEIQNILFYDTLGRLVKSLSFDDNDINITSLPEGNYRVVFITATDSVEQTLVIIR